MNPLVKRFFFIGICLFFYSLSAQAKTMYITDTLKITVRAGQGTSHKILAIIESGQKIEVIKKGNQWTLVRLTDGKEGWVYSRYLADIPTSDIKLEKLNLKHKNLIAQVESFQEKNHKHKLENKTLSAALATSKKSFNNLQGDYEALKADSSKYLILKSKYEKVSSQLSEQTRKTKNLEEQISELQLYYFLKWVLAVGGILLVGFIIGHSVKRPRRQPALL